MTDYASLDYYNNENFKSELKRFINLLNENNIHYWVDFSYLEKIKRPSKFLNYLISFDICLFEDSYNQVIQLAAANNFTIWYTSDLTTSFVNNNFFYIKDSYTKFNTKETFIQGMLKWIVLWNFKNKDNENVHLNIEKDYVYNKLLFSEIEEIEYCDLKLKIPKNYDEIRKIRYSNSKGVVFCHTPRKRENCEKKYSFNNLGDYK